MMRRNLLILSIIVWMLLTATLIHAQDDEDLATDTTIAYDDEVTDTITQQSFFDLFRFNGSAGEVVVITVTASDGLAPLIGLLNPGRNLVAVSEDGVVNGRIELEYEIVETGEHVINVTRVGRDAGTTSGNYTLLLRRASAQDTRINSFQDVTFRCGAEEVTTAATLNFPQLPGEQLTFYLYGFGDFRPILRTEVDLETPLEDCSNDSQRLGGQIIMMPDGETLTLPEGEPENAAQFGLSASGEINGITLTVGSIEGGVGRYMLVMTGFNIEPAGNLDVLEVRLGPLVAESSSVSVYMVAESANRLDPLIEVFNNEDFDVPAFSCDDAGQRDCEAVLSFDGAGVVFDEETALIGDRFDAGVLLNPGNTDPQSLEFSSRAESATGRYAIVIIGEILPRETESGD